MLTNLNITLGIQSKEDSTEVKAPALSHLSRESPQSVSSVYPLSYSPHPHYHRPSMNSVSHFPEPTLSTTISTDGVCRPTEQPGSYPKPILFLPSPLSVICRNDPVSDHIGFPCFLSPLGLWPCVCNKTYKKCLISRRCSPATPSLRACSWVNHLQA